MKNILLILVVFAFCFLTSCSSKLYSSPVLASTKAVSVPEHKVLGKVDSKDCEVMVLFWPMPANYKKMYNDVFEQSKGMGGDAIVDYQVSQKSFTAIFPLFMSACYVASGTAVKFTNAGDSSAWDISPEAEQTKPEQPSVWD